MTAATGTAPSERTATVPAPTIGRLERFAAVGSTNDVVRDWLAAGEPEICVAVADEQTAGRGRNGRTWTAPPNAGLLLSAGFRPTWLPVDRVWRLAATVSMAMAEAAEEVAGLADGSIGLKWPNDLFADGDGPLRKLGGVLGESDGLGTDDPRVVVGIGLNVDWAAADFPADLRSTMTSLRVLAGRPVDADRLLSTFVERLTVLVGWLRDGAFDARQWIDRQVTTGRTIDLIAPDGAIESVVAHGVDPNSGALLVGDGRNRRSVFVGEIRHVRLSGV
ncbi:MAG TPA: biotin--[acetyl-CoA-carboxylase] ligase [Candidatus Limnocylindrales bacterium]|nr:biotin--[acetyl-CoA-carboxylase] ligase [Candidatus Limnocylindrales bacterium]